MGQTSTKERGSEWCGGGGGKIIPPQGIVHKILTHNKLFPNKATYQNDESSSNIATKILTQHEGLYGELFQLITMELQNKHV